MVSEMEALAEAGEAIAATSGKLEKTRILADFLRSRAPASLPIATIFFTARPFAERDLRTLNLGYAVLRDALCQLGDVDVDTLGAAYLRHSDAGDVTEEVLAGRTHPHETSLTEVATTFERIATERTARAKQALLAGLLDRLTPRAAKYVVKILTGDLRIGLRAGLVEEAVARAFNVELAAVTWANMLTGDLGEVGVLAAQQRLADAHLRLLHPLRFMLASPEETAAAVMARVGGEAWVEDKYDGIRGQLHKQGTTAALYSRDLRDVTGQFPEIVTAARDISHDLLLDGEILAYRDGQVLPFFQLQRRLGRKTQGAALLQEVPVVFVAFDLLFLDGADLLLRPLRERRQALEGLQLPPAFLVAQLVRARTTDELDAIFDAARGRKNEGLMVKNPETGYTPGRRGLAWLKLKKALATLDVVVTGAEFGHGKRRGVLSDYTFAVLDTDTGEFVNIGKAYSGLTDVEIAALTQHFHSTTIQRYGRFHVVEPDTVLEVAFDAIQRSARHKSGFALRFPRIKAIRRDKPITEIDTLANVERMYQAHFAEAKPLAAEEA
jgi:DNA ligase-1